MNLSLSHNPFLTMLGLSLVAWRSGYAEFELQIAPNHLNRQGSLQGGVLATMLDAACGYAGIYSDDHEADLNAVTLSLSISYIARVDRGVVRAIGQTCGGGRSIYFAESRIVDASGQVIATAQGNFKRRAPLPSE